MSLWAGLPLLHCSIFLFTLSVCQTEAGSKDCSHSKMGTNVDFIIAQPMVQHNNKVGTMGGPDMAAIDSLGGGGGHIFCHRLSRRTTCSATDSLGGPHLGGTN